MLFVYLYLVILWYTLNFVQSDINEGKMLKFWYSNLLFEVSIQIHYTPIFLFL